MLGTGWFGATAAEVGPGKTVLSSVTERSAFLAVVASKQMGADRIIVFSRH